MARQLTLDRTPAAALAGEAGKWLATCKTWWSRYLAYKLNFALQVIGPAVVFYFIKLNLWRSIYGDDPARVIQGYTLDAMLAYQGWVMITGMLAQGFNHMNLAEDIRMGRISAYLIYPFSFWKFHAASWLAFQGIQLLVAAVTMGCLGLNGVLPGLVWTAVLKGALFSSLVGLFWFVVTFVMGLISFWLEETWVLRVMFITISQFLSGAIVPLEIYPPWLVGLLEWTPFPAMTYVPARIFMGSHTGSVTLAVVVLLVWTALAALTGRWLWHRGLRLYTAAGM